MARKRTRWAWRANADYGFEIGWLDDDGGFVHQWYAVDLQVAVRFVQEENERQGW